jgi:hypothetical protein
LSVSLCVFRAPSWCKRVVATILIDRGTEVRPAIRDQWSAAGSNLLVHESSSHYIQKITGPL